jgi:hypothetical protein
MENQVKNNILTPEIQISPIFDGLVKNPSAALRGNFVAATHL